MSEAGSVSVRVVPSAQGFWAAFKAQTEGQADAAGQEAGERFAKGVGGKGDDSGREFADKFDRTVRDRLAAAIHTLPNMVLKADATPAERKIGEIRELLQFTDAAIQLHVNDEGSLRAIDRLRAELHILARESPDIRVRLNAAGAEAELLKIRAEMDALDGSNKRVASSSGQAAGGMGLLIDTAILLGPALVPIGAAAAAAFAGLIGSAGTAVLAFKGIKAEMAQGTALGAQYTRAFQPILDEFHQLERISAAGVFNGIHQGILNLRQVFPDVNREVAQLSQSLGVVVGNTGAGLVQLFHALNPLFVALAQQLAAGSTAFLRWASSSTGLQNFVQYATGALPGVEHAIGAIADAIGHIITAAAPLGGPTLQAITDLAAAIASIPTPVLTGLLVALQVSRLGNIAGGLGGISRAIQSVSKYAEEAGTSVGALALSLGPLALAAVGIGITAAAVGSLIDHLLVGSDTADALVAGITKVQQSANKLKDAFLASQGATDSNVRSQIVAIEQQNNLDKAVAQSGTSLSDLTDKVVGNKDAFDKWVLGLLRSGGITKAQAGSLEALKTSVDSSADAAKAAQAAYQNLMDQLRQPGAITTKDSFDALGQTMNITADQVAHFAAEYGITKDQVDNGKVTFGELAGAVHEVADAYNIATTSGRVYLDALDQFSQSAGTAADRAKLIGATLVAANGDALGFAGAISTGLTAVQQFGTHLQQTATDSKTSVSGLTKQLLDLSKGTVSFSDTAAAPLIADLQQMQTSAMNVAQAMFQHEVATKGATKAADDAYGVFNQLTSGALVGQYKQLGLTKQQADDLAKAYFGMPSDVKTKIEQEGGDPTLKVLGDIRDLLHELVDPSWKPTVGPINDKASVPLSALDTKLGLMDKKQAHPDVALIDHVSLPLSAIDQHLGLTGKKVAHPDVVLIDKASVPLSAVDQHLGLTGGKVAKPQVGLVDHVSFPLSAIDQSLNLTSGKIAKPTVQARDFASAVIATINAGLNGLNGRVVTSTIETEHKDIYTVQDAAAGRGAAGATSSLKNAMGGYYPAHAYAGGAESHLAQIGSGYRIWAEPETHGEAYIPLANDRRRARAVAITAKVADDFGFTLQPKAAQGGSPINVYPSAGMDEVALAMAVSRRANLLTV